MRRVPFPRRATLWNSCSRTTTSLGINCGWLVFLLCLVILYQNYSCAHRSGANIRRSEAFCDSEKIWTQQGVGVCEAETSLNECVLEPAEKRGTLRIKFINFWDKFDPSTYFVVDILVALFLDAGVKLCMLPDQYHGAYDVLISSVFGSVRKVEQEASLSKFTLLINFENFGRLPEYYKHLSFGKLFDAVVSGEDSRDHGHYGFPYWFFVPEFHCGKYSPNLKNISKFTPKKPLSERLRRVSFVARHAKSDGLLDGRPRKAAYDSIHKSGVAIDSPSALYKNMPSLESKNISKLDFLQQYVFNLCPENSFHDGYNTEKLMHAVLSGTIPIYWGSYDDRIFNSKRILYYSSLEETEEVATKVKELLSDPEALESLWAMPIFESTAQCRIVEYFEKLEDLRSRILAMCDVEVEV